MGDSGRHRRVHRFTHLRTRLLTVAGLAAAMLAAAVATLIGAGRSAPRADVGAAVAPAAPPIVPERASRAQRRGPLRALSARHRTAGKRARRPAREVGRGREVGKSRSVGKAGTEVVAQGSCEASFYGTGPATASGAPFDPQALTAAHRTLPMGSLVRVTNLGNARSVVVRINDRGPFVPGRCLDLSTAAMRAVGGVLSGVIPVRYEVLGGI